MPPQASTALARLSAAPDPGVDAAVLAAAFEGVAGGVAIYDADDVLVFCNAAYRDGLGPGHDPVGRRFRDILAVGLHHRPPGATRTRSGPFRRAARDPSRGAASEAELADGRTVRVEDRRPRDGGSVVTLRDVSRLRERELAARDRLLRMIFDEIGEGLAVVDSGLRLVAWNRHFAALLALPEERIRVGVPIREIVRFQVQRGEFGEVDVDAEVERQMRPSWPEAPIEYRRRTPAGRTIAIHRKPIAGGGWLTIYSDVTESEGAAAALRAAARAAEAANRAKSEFLADPRLVRQVLLNLLANAVKFTPRGGRVRVDVDVDAGAPRLSITDTGIGMSESQIPQALAPFVQIDSRLSRKYEGTGLGLPLVKRFVELHGGRLEIESGPDDGTTVTVTFPGERLAAADPAGSRAGG